MGDQNAAGQVMPCDFKLSGVGICNRPATAGGSRCILHKRDRSPEEDEQFDETVRCMMRDQDCDFRGVNFPEGFGAFAHAVFSQAAHFERARFAGDADFTGARFNDAGFFGNALIRGSAKFDSSRFSQNANFVKVRIAGDARFTEAEIQGAGLFSALDVGGSVRFHNAAINGLVQFGGARVGESLVFTRAEIGGAATFAHTRVTGVAEFSSARIKDECDFSYMKFGGDVQFAGAHIEGGVTFRGAAIAQALFFRGTTVNGSARFVGTEVGGNAIFSEMQVRKKGDWHRMDVRGRVYFTDIHVHGDADFCAMNAGTFVHFGNAVFEESVDLRGATLPPAGDFTGVKIRTGRSPSFCRFAKQVCQNMGEYHEAGDWHYLERCHGWYARVFLERGSKRVVTLLNPITWIEYVVGRWVFGYGESPTRVIVTAFLVIFACAWGYKQMPGVWHSMNEKALSSYADALYFSIVTFTTLGFGDYQPQPGGSAVRLLVMAEALAGAFLMALFVVTLARRWGRG